MSQNPSGPRQQRRKKNGPQTGKKVESNTTNITIATGEKKDLPSTQRSHRRRNNSGIPNNSSRRKQELNSKMLNMNINRSAQGAVNKRGYVPNMSDAVKVAAGVSDPRNAQCFRISSAYTDVPTAVVNPFIIDTVDYGPQPDWHINLFNDLLCNHIVYIANTSNSSYTYTYNGFGSSAETVSSTTPRYYYKDMNFEQGEVLFYTPVYPIATTTGPFKPHTDVVYGATPDGTSQAPDRFYWLEKDTVIAAEIFGTNNLPTTPLFNLVIKRWEVDKTVQNYTSSAPVTIATSAISSTIVDLPGYYSITFALSTAAAPALNAYFSVKITYSGSTFVHGHRPAPNLATNISTIKASRVSANSILLKNIAAPIYREGRIAANQFPDKTVWYENMTFTRVSSAPTSITIEAKNGIYGYRKPTSPSDYDLKSYFTVSNGQIYDSFWPLNRSAFVCIAVQVSQDTAKDFTFEVCPMIEFTTENNFFPTAVPDITNASFEEAMMILKSLVQFVENPIHIPVLLHGIQAIAKTGAAAVAKYGPSAIKALPVNSRIKRDLNYGVDVVRFIKDL